MDKYYHQQKTMDCAKQGIQLIHIFEHEWNIDNTRDKVLKLIDNKLGIKSKRIYGRNIEIKLIDSEETNKFLHMYHINNGTPSSIKIGCYYNNEIVGVMTFGKPRFNTNYEYELHRLCWHPDYVVIGGVEKLFRYFVDNYNPTSIITYCDISKFTGNVYTRLGFKPIQPNPITEPNYIWWMPHSNNILRRYSTQKHILVKNEIGKDTETEDEIMYNLGYLKIYDSGNLRLAWYKNN